MLQVRSGAVALTPGSPLVSLLRVIALDAFLFDLDGTLVDSRLDLAAAVNAALTAAGRPPKPAAVITGYVGHGVATLLHRSFETTDPAIIGPATAAFRSHYRAHCLDQTSLYPGVRETLDHFHEKALAVVTNKPEDFARQIITGIGLANPIPVIVGGGSLGPGNVLKPDPAPLLHALEQLGASPSRAVIVGDGITDIEAGQRAHIRTCAVTYGFTSAAILAAARPDHTISRFSELRELFA